MSISSSMNAGIAGLQANTTRLSTISDNIANSATYGYRRAQTSFHSMVLGDGRANQSSYAAGGVRTSTMRLIDQGGQLIGTRNSTDLAINGRGFLPVTTQQGANMGPGAMPMQLMTTGSFRFDSDGFLRNPTGMTLLGWAADADGSIPAQARNSSASLVPIRLDNAEQAPTPTANITLNLNLPASATLPDAPGTVQELTIDYVDATGLVQKLDVTYTPTVDPVAGQTNPRTLTITDPADGGATVSEHVLDFGGAMADGGLLTGVTGPGYDPDAGTFTITMGDQDIAVGIGALLDPSGTTQNSTAFSPFNINSDGFTGGELVGVEVTSDGLVQAVFDSGYTRTLYQVPLVDVPNPNGLQSLNDQVYALSADSGDFYLWNAGDGPTGTVQGYALEQSATDVAEELTGLIQTQRAYSSNVKIIQTVDEMLQETTNLKR